MESRKIKISELRAACNLVFDQLEAEGNTAIDLDIKNDFYWDLEDRMRFDLKGDAAKLVTGSIADDLDFVESMLGDSFGHVLMLMHITPILTYIRLRLAPP
jgi:hypothetical protein